MMATAYWNPALRTDAHGQAKVQFPAPDNLTAFRLMATAADAGDRFGSSDLRFAVTKPLQLHAALPRFLTAGDRIRGGVVVHNETGQTGVARVTASIDYKPVITWAAEGKPALGLLAAFDAIEMDETYHLRPRMSRTIPCSNC